VATYDHGNSYNDCTAPYVPSPRQIQAGMRKIRKRWGAYEENKRRVVKQRPYEIPTMHSLPEVHRRLGPGESD